LLAEGAVTQFIFTSDAHYGLYKDTFRCVPHASAHDVNAALVRVINHLSESTFPKDGGLRGGLRIGPIDFVVEGGDVANRQEGAGADAIQAAARSWSDFAADYIDGINVRASSGKPAPVYVVPGNHEGSNAVGFYKPMSPATDTTPMVEIFNRMTQPRVPRTVSAFNYTRDRVVYSRDVEGVHFVFLQIWPDSAARAWMEHDLANVSSRTPVVVFVHDQPEAEAKHFRNPNSPYNVNGTDKFENLLADILADGLTIDAGTMIEQRAFEKFLRQHPNIRAYFHGNSNWNQFYEWHGPDRTASLRVFRVDSPMKGRYSANDERRLSFHVVTIDRSSMTMSVRECLWNHPDAVAWGEIASVSLALSGSSRRPWHPPNPHVR